MHSFLDMELTIAYYPHSLGNCSASARFFFQRKGEGGVRGVGVTLVDPSALAFNNVNLNLNLVQVLRFGF